MVSWLHALGQKIMAAGNVVEELIHLMDDRKEVGQGLNTPSICPQ
jgi:hypothetical protein